MVVTVDATREIKLYVNGESKDTKLGSSDAFNDPKEKYSFLIGNNREGLTWRGYIFELEIRQSTYTSSEVALWYNYCRIDGFWYTSRTCIKECESGFFYNGSDCSDAAVNWTMNFIFDKGLQT